MSDPRLRETEAPAARGSQNTLFFIVGGLVILVGIIAWVMFGGDTTPDSTTIDEPAATGDTDTGTTTGTTTETDTGTTTDTTQ